MFSRVLGPATHTCLPGGWQIATAAVAYRYSAAQTSLRMVHERLRDTGKPWQGPTWGASPHGLNCITVLVSHIVKFVPLKRVVNQRSCVEDLDAGARARGDPRALAPAARFQTRRQAYPRLHRGGGGCPAMTAHRGRITALSQHEGAGVYR